MSGKSIRSVRDNAGSPNGDLTNNQLMENDMNIDLDKDIMGNPFLSKRIKEIVSKKADRAISTVLDEWPETRKDLNKNISEIVISRLLNGEMETSSSEKLSSYEDFILALNEEEFSQELRSEVFFAMVIATKPR